MHPIKNGGITQGLRLKSHAPNLARTKWIGTYEKELEAFIEIFLKQRPRLIFDIGAAEGYYALGVLLRNKESRCIAWEALEERRKLLEQNAVTNSCSSRLTIRGKCTAPSLAKAIAEEMPDLLICDIEGAETDILTQETIGALRRTRLLIETHGHDICATMVSRMTATHNVHIIEPRNRTVADWPLRRIWATPPYKHYALQECRSKFTPWVLGTPKPYA